MELKNAISHYALVSSRANNSDASRLKLRTNSYHSRLKDGIRPGNGIQRDNMNRKVESKLTRSIWIGRRSSYAWPSRDPRSRCDAWCMWENSIICIPCIRGRIKIWDESGPNSISFPELRSPWPAVGKRELWEQPLWKNKGNNRILVIRLTAHLHLWRMPEMVAPRALVFLPLVKGNEALGTRLGQTTQRSNVWRVRSSSQNFRLTKS